MGMPAYFNPYMAMPGTGVLPLAMPGAHYGPPNASEAAAAHGFAAVPQPRPLLIDPQRMQSMAPAAFASHGPPLSPTGV